MASRQVQGQSHATEDKARGFLSIFETNLRASKAILSRSPSGCRYFHFDLHGGSGFNEEVNVVGSPVLFSEVATREVIPFRMHVSEHDRERAKLCGGRLLHCENSFVHFGDNRELTALIPDIIRDCGETPKYAIGSILIDPNGIKREIPWEELRVVSLACPRLDVILNYNATAAKRSAGAGYTDGLVLLSDVPRELNKEFWVIRKPRGEHQFTLVVGRNMRIGDHKRLEFYDWNSELGRQCLRAAMNRRGERAVPNGRLFE